MGQSAVSALISYLPLLLIRKSHKDLLGGKMATNCDCPPPPEFRLPPPPDPSLIWNIDFTLDDLEAECSGQMSSSDGGRSQTEIQSRKDGHSPPLLNNSQLRLFGQYFPLFATALITVSIVTLITVLILLRLKRSNQCSSGEKHCRMRGANKSASNSGSDSSANEQPVSSGYVLGSTNWSYNSMRKDQLQGSNRQSSSAALQPASSLGMLMYGGSNQQNQPKNNISSRTLPKRPSRACEKLPPAIPSHLQQQRPNLSAAKLHHFIHQNGKNDRYHSVDNTNIDRYYEEIPANLRRERRSMSNSETVTVIERLENDANAVHYHVMAPAEALINRRPPPTYRPPPPPDSLPSPLQFGSNYCQCSDSPCSSCATSSSCSFHALTSIEGELQQIQNNGSTNHTPSPKRTTENPLLDRSCCSPATKKLLNNVISRNAADDSNCLVNINNNNNNNNNNGRESGYGTDGQRRSSTKLNGSPSCVNANSQRRQLLLVANKEELKNKSQQQQLTVYAQHRPCPHQAMTYV